MPTVRKAHLFPGGDFDHARVSTEVSELLEADCRAGAPSNKRVGHEQSVKESELDRPSSSASKVGVGEHAFVCEGWEGGYHDLYGQRELGQAFADDNKRLNNRPRGNGRRVRDKLPLEGQR